MSRRAFQEVFITENRIYRLMLHHNLAYVGGDSRYNDTLVIPVFVDQIELPEDIFQVSDKSYITLMISNGCILLSLYVPDGNTIPVSAYEEFSDMLLEHISDIIGAIEQMYVRKTPSFFSVTNQIIKWLEVLRNV